MKVYAPYKSLALCFTLALLLAGCEKMKYDASEYSAVASRINNLEIQELIARGKNADVDTAEIDKQLAPLRARLAELQPRHDREVEAELSQAEGEAQRQRQEQEQQSIQAMKREAAELEKRCEGVRSKRIVDLTINDVELLKQCGTPIPHLPIAQ
jgi:predicted transcriptional regulator